MNIQERLAKIRFFRVVPDFSSLTVSERNAMRHCVGAARIMTDVYLEQAYAGNKTIQHALMARSDREGVDLLRYFNIHGGPWDAYDHDNPFIPGVGPKQKFGSFYPLDMSKEEWDNLLASCPEGREEFESNYTVIRREGKELVAVPYSMAYAEHLAKANRELKRAVLHLSRGVLKSFLELRAAAFLSNDYFESDMAWVDTDGHPFEVTIGPYEVYFDALLGLKASFEAFIGIPDRDATEALKRFTPLVPEFDRLLAQEFNFNPKGAAIPLEVVADVIRGGEAAFGYMFIAYNLPNDRRVHDLKGSKKVFSRTMMQAKFDTLSTPIAERILAQRELAHWTFDNRLLFVLGHELAHGLGPSKIRDGNREVPFEILLRDLHSCLEEAKADMLGVRLLNFFRSRGSLDDHALYGAIVSQVAGYFMTWRHGFTEAHSRGDLIEYNWLRAHSALRFNMITKRLEIDFERALFAMELLSTEFLRLQQAGDYHRAKAFMEQWGTVPDELPTIIESLSDLPTAVSPIYDLAALPE